MPPYLRDRRGAPLFVAAGLPRAYGLPPFPNPTDRGAESPFRYPLRPSQCTVKDTVTPNPQGIAPSIGLP